MDTEDQVQDLTIEINRLYNIRLPDDFGSKKSSSSQSTTGPRGVLPKKPSITTVTFDWRTCRLYAGTDAGQLCFWPLKKEREGTLWLVGEHKGQVSCIRIPEQQDGELSAAQLVVSGSYDATIKIWDFKGKIIQSPSVCVQTLYGHGGTITEIAILGDHIISSSTDSTIRVWKAVPGRQQLQYPWFEHHATIVTMDGWVRCMSFRRSATETSSEVERLYAADDTGAVICITATPIIHPTTLRAGNDLELSIVGRFATASGIPLAFRKMHDRGITHIRYYPAQGLVLTLAYDHCIRVYEVASGQLRHCWENENCRVFTGLELDEEEMQVVAVDAAGCMFLYSLQRDALEVTKQIAQQPILGLTKCLQKDLYAVFVAGEIQVWEIKRDLEYGIVRGGHSKEVISIYACSGGKKGGKGGYANYRIFSASLDNTVRLWDPYDLCCLRVYEELESEISAMMFHESSNMLVTGHDNGSIRLWNMDSGATITLRGHENTVSTLTSACIHKSSEWLVSACYDGAICFWELVTNRGEGPHQTAKLQYSPGPSLLDGTLVPSDGHRVEVQCAKYDPINMVLYTCGNNPAIKVWCLQTSHVCGHLIGHKDSVTCMALYAELVFSGSQDGSICMWHPVPPGQQGNLCCIKAKPLQVMLEHKQSVTGLEVLESRNQLVSVALDGQVIFWSIHDGTAMHRLQLSSAFRCVAPRFDVDEILLGTEDGTIVHVPLDHITA